MHITEFCIDGHLRLAGGKDVTEGRVEICNNGVWGTVYDGNWDSLDASVVCRQLGFYQTHSSMYTRTHACMSVKLVLIYLTRS